MPGPSTPRRIIRKKTASDRTGLSCVHMWRLEKDDRFPHRVQLSERAVGYYEDEIDDWIHSRIRAAGRFRGHPFWLNKTVAPAQAQLPDDDPGETSSETEESRPKPPSLSLSQHENSDRVCPIGAGRLRGGSV
jgi:prophage regulatory protein